MARFIRGTVFFYGQAYETLRSRHDTIKSGYEREFYSSLSDNDFRAAVCAFAIQSYAADAISFPEDKARDFALHVSELVPIVDYDSQAFLHDLVSSVCLVIQDGLELRFTHRSFQEYFAAVFILTFGGAQRRELLWNLRFRLNVDNTARLLLELDRITFEDEFLRRAIGFVNDEFLQLARHADVGEALATVLREHATIRISQSNLDVELDSEESLAAIGIVGFICHEFFQTVFRWSEPSSEGIVRLRRGVIDARIDSRAKSGNLNRMPLLRSLLASTC